MENTPPPSQPAPLFQQVPQAPLPPKKQGMSGCTIAVLVTLGVLGLIAILAALAVPAYNRVREQAAKLAEETRKKKAEAYAVPLSAAEKPLVEAYVSRLLVAIEEDDLAAMESSVDYAEVADEVFAGMSVSSEMKKGFIKGVQNNRGGVFANVVGQQGHLVRHHLRDGIPSVTLRFVNDDSGASYVDLILKRDGAGGFKCIDLYNYLFGARVTTEGRRAIAIMMNSDTSALAKILGMPIGTNPDVIKDVTAISSSFKTGDYNAVIQGYESLKPEMQKQVFLYGMYVQALQVASNEKPELNAKYAEVLGKARSILGEDVTIDLLMVDMHFLQGDLKAARADVEASLRTIGDDSYLYHLLGLMCVRTNDLPAAEAALAKAEKIEPDLFDLIDLRMMIQALKKDYTGLVKTMTDFAAKTGAELTPDLLSEAVYDDFKKSPEFTKWAEGLTK